MHKKTTLLLLLLATLFTACKDKKEADCVAPIIEQNLLGTWQATFTSESGNAGPGTVTFREDGTVTGIGALYKDDFSPNSIWKGDGWERDKIGIAITFRGAASAAGPYSVFSKGSYYVDENECNKVVLRSTFNGTFALTR